MNDKRKKDRGKPGAGERSLHNLAAHTLFGLALVDDALRLCKFNRKFVSFFPAAEPGGLLCDALGRHCSRPDGCAGCPAARCLSKGGQQERDFVRQAEASPERYFRLAAFPARLAPGKPAAPAVEQDGSLSEGGGKLALVLLEDVSQKRELERKLARVSRLEAMSTLAGGIAHEINQPLSALNLYAGSLQMLLDKDELPPPHVIRERIGLILDQARKISDITRHMRATAAQASSLPEKADALEALAAAVRSLNPRLNAAGIKLLVRRPQRLPAVKAVSVQLCQVFTNLIANAAQALHGGGSGRPGGEKLIRVSLNRENERVLVEVADSGPGVPPGQERRIFDPFFTTRGPSGGMGLGLSIVHAFLRSWDGDIQAVSKHPELGGAAFNIALKVFDDGE